MYYLSDVALTGIGYALLLVLGCILGYITGHYYGKKKGYDDGFVAGEMATWVKMDTIVKRNIKTLRKEGS